MNYSNQMFLCGAVNRTSREILLNIRFVTWGTCGCPDLGKVMGNCGKLFPACGQKLARGEIVSDGSAVAQLNIKF